MSFARQKSIEALIERFGYLRSVIELHNSQNFTTINVISENFFRDLLNLCLGLELVNINIEDANAAAIDLGDKQARIAIQVTATGSKAKVEKTLKKFCENDLQNSYDKLIVLVSTKKSKFRDKTLSDVGGKHTINLEDDVWDWDKITSILNNLPEKDLTTVCEFVEREIKFGSRNAIQKEVATFIDLIEMLSDETHSEAGRGFIREPDPERKIEGRFSAHADFLLGEYTRYYAEYGSVLEETKKSGDFGSARLRRLGLHLGTKSDQVLAVCRSDPQRALEIMVEFYVQTLQKHSKSSDEGAVRFFLLDQMIRCHVFPNPVRKSA